MEMEAELSRIIINEMSDQQVIVLKERHGQRSFPIVIGIVEIFAIDRRLKGIKPARPMTHDLLASVIENLGAKIEKIVINDLRHHVFYWGPQRARLFLLRIMFLNRLLSKERRKNQRPDAQAQ